MDIKIKNRKVFLNGRRAKWLCHHSRYIYKCGRYIIKFQNGFGFGYMPEQSFNEYITWKKIEKKDRKFFAKLIKFIKHTKFGSCVIQEFIPGIGGNLSNKQWRTLERVAHKYKIEDLHRGNVRIDKRTHKAKIIDYGC
jgi:hypothetical protein